MSDEGSPGRQPRRRLRPMIAVTLSPEAIERLDEMARRTGTSRSGAIEALVRAATMPRAR